MMIRKVLENISELLMENGKAIFVASYLLYVIGVVLKTINTMVNYWDLNTILKKYMVMIYLVLDIELKRLRKNTKMNTWLV